MCKDFRIVMAGCGAVGQGILPLLRLALGIKPDRLSIISADDSGRRVADLHGVRYAVEPLTPGNYRAVLERHLRAGDILLNLSVDVSSLALIAWCQSRDVMYLDTCVEPWGGGYQGGVPLQTTNAWLRQQALALHRPGASTAVIAHGMNPGLVSHFLKEALLELARLKGMRTAPSPEWGALAQALGVRAVHISERDTQDGGGCLMPGEFANTWSAAGFYSESWLQKAEAGWGSHESALPHGASLMPFADSATVRFAQRGADMLLRTWVPSCGEQTGMLVTHHEVASLSGLLTHGRYRPTVCYVYNPCRMAWASFAALHAGHPVSRFRVLEPEMLHGFDEVGVLLLHDAGALWHGSMLHADEARRLVPHNNATTLQVAAGLIGALAWMQNHPRAGVVEAEAMDSTEVLAAARPWLGSIVTRQTGWSQGGSHAFGEFFLPAGMQHPDLSELAGVG